MTNRALLVELARVRVIFQMKALAAVMGLPKTDDGPAPPLDNKSNRLGGDFAQTPAFPVADDLCEFSGWPGPQKCDCGEVYPMYGVAPHECYWRKGPEFTIGQSTLLPVEEWTELFVPELEDGEDWEDFQYPSACGVFYCPVCQQDRYAKAWNALCERIGPPPATSGKLV